jgi:hypothetical protein
VSNGYGTPFSAVRLTAAEDGAERAHASRTSGGEAACDRQLREAHRLFTEIGAPIRAAEVAKELGLATAS